MAQAATILATNAVTSVVPSTSADLAVLFDPPPGSGSTRPSGGDWKAVVTAPSLPRPSRSSASASSTSPGAPGRSRPRARTHRRCACGSLGNRATSCSDSPPSATRTRPAGRARTAGDCGGAWFRPRRFSEASTVTSDVAVPSTSASRRPLRPTTAGGLRGGGLDMHLGQRRGDHLRHRTAPASGLETRAPVDHGRAGSPSSPDPERRSLACIHAEQA